MKINLRHLLTTTALSLFIFLGMTAARAQTASFAYQGKLTDGALAANGSYQMQFGLFAAAVGGSQIGAPQTSTVTVANGVFTVNLGFGASAFDGTDRFLQISIFSPATNAFVALTPRQQITSAPYAIKSLNAANADNSLNLGGVAANQYVQTTDARLTDDRNPRAGSGNYIQNNTSLQAADIYISGEMSANGFNSNFGYSIDGDSVLTAPGVANYFVGYGAGGQTTTGNNNSFFGFSSGFANTTGSNNSLVGAGSNVGGGNLTFAAAIGANSVVTTSNTIVLGRSGGQDTVQIPGVLNVANQYNLGGIRVLSVAGTENLFVGENSGAVNSTGSANSFFGLNSGLVNTTGANNAFFGRGAGQGNTTGTDNSFFGRSAGFSNSTGGDNSFFGRSAGIANTTGNNNSFFGRSTGAANNIGTFNSFFGSLTGDSNTSGNNNTFIGAAAGGANTIGNSNTFVGLQAGEGNTSGDDNVFIGVNAGNTNTTGSSNTYIGNNAKGNAGIINAVAIGANAFANQSNGIYLGTQNQTVVVPGAAIIKGRLTVEAIVAAGVVSVCRTLSNEFANCSSSLRYKTNIAPFTSGLSILNRLRPITFDWKQGGARDLGLGAEDVAAVEELLVNRNEKGEVEGVKYDRVGVVLINAVREQQTQIEALKQQIELLQKLVCSQNPNTEICQEK
jgi:hypothetical protein